MSKDGGRARGIARAHAISKYKEYATCKMCRHWVNNACVLGLNPEKDIYKAIYCKSRHLVGTRIHKNSVVSKLKKKNRGKQLKPATEMVKIGNRWVKRIKERKKRRWLLGATTSENVW